MFFLIQQKSGVGYCALEPFHFEKALTDNGASLVRANEEQAKCIFAANSECSVSKITYSRGVEENLPFSLIPRTMRKNGDTMKTVRILAVGTIREPHWQAAFAHYAKRLSHMIRLDCVAVKDAGGKLPPRAKSEEESARLLRALNPADCCIGLDEKGLSLTSAEFAAFMRKLYDHGQVPAFLIGGAYGLSDEARNRARHLVGLSPLTFTHEMAQVLLLEQLYRAESILSGTGYHHG